MQGSTLGRRRPGLDIVIGKRGAELRSQDRPIKRERDNQFMTSRIRIIQYGLGPIGAAIARLIAAKPGAELVGAIDIDPAKVGKDLGRLIGLDNELGVRVSDNAQEVLSREAEIVVHTTSSYLGKVKDQLIGCLNAGHNVVSTCEELSYPFRKYPELSQELNRHAVDNSVTLHGTGVNPGFVMDKLALTLSSVCQQVHGVRITRVVNASLRRLPLQKKVGAGMTEAEFKAEVSAGRIKHHGLPESAGLIADGMGLTVSDITESIEPVLAIDPVVTDHLKVEPGQVAGVRQVCRGTDNGKERIYLELRMYVGAPDPADTIHIDGVPGLSLTIPGGTHGDLATAAAVVNSIALVVKAEPGLKTVADIPVRFHASF